MNKTEAILSDVDDGYSRYATGLQLRSGTGSSFVFYDAN